MFDGKRVVALIFDRSYMIYDLTIPMNIIYDALFYNKNNNNIFVFGGIPRLCYHVTHYAEALKISKERLIHIEIPDSTSRLITAENMQSWFMQVLKYMPDILIVLRDNTGTQETNRLVDWAIRNHITVSEYDNRGGCNNLSLNSLTDPKVNNLNVIDPSLKGRKYR